MIPTSIIIIGQQGIGKTLLAGELIANMSLESNVKFITAQTLILTPFVKLNKDILYLVDELMDCQQLESLIDLITITHVKCIITTNAISLMDVAKFKCPKLAIIQL